jgi:hypothetical protein
MAPSASPYFLVRRFCGSGPVLVDLATGGRALWLAFFKIATVVGAARLSGGAISDAVLAIGWCLPLRGDGMVVVRKEGCEATVTDDVLHARGVAQAPCHLRIACISCERLHGHIRASRTSLCCFERGECSGYLIPGLLVIADRLVD